MRRSRRCWATTSPAWASPEIDVVLAHTLAGPGASVRVLEKAGFAKDGESTDAEVGAVWSWRLARER